MTAFDNLRPKERAKRKGELRAAARAVHREFGGREYSPELLRTAGAASDGELARTRAFYDRRDNAAFWNPVERAVRRYRRISNLAARCS